MKVYGNKSGPVQTVIYGIAHVPPRQAEVYDVHNNDRKKNTVVYGIKAKNSYSWAEIKEALKDSPYANEDRLAVVQRMENPKGPIHGGMPTEWDMPGSAASPVEDDDEFDAAQLMLEGVSSLVDQGISESRAEQMIKNFIAHLREAGLDML